MRIAMIGSNGQVAAERAGHEGEARVEAGRHPMDRPNEAARAAADQTEPENGLRHLFRSSPHRHEPAGAGAPPSSAGAAASFSRKEQASSEQRRSGQEEVRAGTTRGGP